MSWATSLRRFSAPTMASSCAHRVFELLLTLDFLALGRFLELRVDSRAHALVHVQLSQAAFVVDRHRRFILDRALDVVDADVVAKHRPGVGVLEVRWACR